MTEPVSVRGGSDGIEAHCEELLVLAHEYSQAALHTGEQALGLHGYLVHPAVLAAAGLDPVGAGLFEGELLAALDGPYGLSLRALDCTSLSVGLRGAVAIYEAADTIESRALPALTMGLRIPGAIGNALPAVVRGHPGAGLDAFVTGDPFVADLGVDALTGFWSNWLLTDSVGAYPDGHPQVAVVGTDRQASEAPHSLAGLIQDLSHRNDGAEGDVGVSFVVGADGRRRVIVDIPGTKSWDPRTGRPNITGGGTNLRSLTGKSTAYEAGVLEAMRRAGVTSSDEVLLVGHSQGGMVAVNAAATAARTGQFRITHVVTAGSPIARLPVSRSVQVLALENDGDIVPHLDGAANPDRTNVTTVTINRDHHRFLANHSLPESYLPGAGDVDASTSRSVRDYLSGLRQFLSGTRMQTTVFNVTRR